MHSIIQTALTVAKWLISLCFVSFFVLATADILSGSKPLIDEVLVVLLAVGWFIFLVSHKMPPPYLIFLFLFIFFIVIHNSISFQLRREEDTALLLSLLSLLTAIVLLSVEMARSALGSLLFPHTGRKRKLHV